MVGFRKLASEPDVHLPAYPALRFDMQFKSFHNESFYDKFHKVQWFSFSVQSCVVPKALYFEDS